MPDAPKVEPVEIWPGQADMARLQKLLWASKQPIVIVGGSRWSEAACASLARFGERFAVPIASQFRRGHLIDSKHPSYAGDVGLGPNPKLIARIKAADLVILIGGRMSEIPSQSYSLFEIPAPRQTFVHIHPGSEELGRVYHPHLAINAAPTGFAAALEGLQPPNEIAWRDGTKTMHADYIAWTEKATPQPGAVNVGEIMVWLRERVPDAIVCNGAGNFSAWVHRFFWWKHFGQHVAPMSGSMGYGLPAAVGIKRAFPEKTVVCIAGDGDFMMHGQEFMTAVQYELPFVTVIVDNSCYGTIRMHQEREYPGRVDGDRPAQSGFRGLCARVRRLRRHGRQDRGFRQGVRGGGGVRQARDHPSQDRHQRDPPGADAGRHPRAGDEGAGRVETSLGTRISRSVILRRPRLRGPRRMHGPDGPRRMSQGRSSFEARKSAHLRMTG